YREQKGLKSIEFAQMLGLKYPTYLNYENNGKEPKFEILVKIADLLNVSLDELLGRDFGKLERYIRFCENIGFNVSYENEKDGLLHIFIDEDNSFFIGKNDFIDVLTSVLSSKEYEEYTSMIICNKFRELENMYSLMVEFDIKDVKTMKELLNRLKAQYASTKKDIKK
ncbi:MAG: helix-turn-helix transcriptional regulator, partial [Dialister micraerophilus]|uniref:helix-turn-helix domain-containing protein n=1 Tax=Dialister micraerophilus TaxID=309120 RepID=UPI002550526B